MTRLAIDLNDPNGHVTQFSFGYAGRPKGGRLDQLYAELGAVRPSTAEMLLREAYLDDYGIRPADAPRHPLDVVRMYDKEDTVEGGSVRTLMRKYRRFDIKETWGLSWAEFKDLPYDEVAYMLEVGEADALRKISEQGKLKREMDSEIRTMQREAK